jgi:hypothetical protein
MLCYCLAAAPESMYPGESFCSLEVMPIMPGTEFSDLHMPNRSAGKRDRIFVYRQPKVSWRFVRFFHWACGKSNTQTEAQEPRVKKP